MVCLSILLLELGLLVTINLRRPDKESRDDGSFSYVFFRHYNLLAFFLLAFPSSYIIEIQGISRCVTLGLLIGCLGMWFTHNELYTMGMFLISSGIPFVANTITTVSQRWYGPKGRNIATAVMLVSLSLPVGLETMINEKFEKSLEFPLPIITSVMIVISLMFIYERPEFSPTLSEEDKIEMKRTSP